MSGRHLRRAPAWWLRRALLLAVALLVGAAVGAGVTIALDRGDGSVATGAGDGAARLEPSTGPIRIALAGEIGAGEALTAALAGPAPGVLGPWAEVLAGAHVAVVDLSAPVVDGSPADPGAAAWAPAAVLDALEAVGVDVVAVANDRALDLGVEGLYATLGAADGRRLGLVGSGPDEAAAYAPAVREVGGRTVAVLAAAQELVPDRIATDTAGPDQAGVASAKRLDRLVEAVEAARTDADVVVVYVHWGEAGQTCPSASQQELAQALVDAGADVVAGTGAGTVQGAGRLGDAVVAYGLGGLVDDGAVEAGAVVVEVGKGGVSGWSWWPGEVVDGVARPVPAERAEDAGAELDARQACAGLSP